MRNIGALLMVAVLVGAPLAAARASAGGSSQGAAAYWSPGGGLSAGGGIPSFDASLPYQQHPGPVEPKGMTAATKARLTNVAQRVDSLIDQHKCGDAATLAKNEGGAVMADMATKICALRYSDAK
ncbi:hypothetical protein FBZ92_10736 [Nitrospirillum viridazoti]|uniref:Uncharacterized protein n=2 Tax=Nitrospirillum TaxID=1543705 RepID=A0A560IKN5_9PROT|nr:hypothetical protein FBZ92_10736 [Nitrospirillum amazonense]